MPALQYVASAAQPTFTQQRQEANSATMTEFKKATAAVDKMEAAVKAATEESTSPELKKQLWDEATSLESEWEAKILKMKSKADEKDPDKKVYGEGMTAKVLALYERYYSATEMLRDVAGAVTAAYQPLADAKQAEAAEAAANMERLAERERRLKAEVERQLQEEVEEARREAEQREVERQKRYEEAVLATLKEKERQARLVEEEKEGRAALYAYLNETPTRILLREGIEKMYHDCCVAKTVTKKGVDPLRLFDETVRGMAQFARNLSGHPDSEALKHLRFSNENFAREVAGRGEGPLSVLYSLGYRPAGFGENKFLVLEEIDPVDEYEKWDAWWQEAKWTRDYFDKLVDTLRFHRTQPGDYALGPNLPFVPKEMLELHVAKQRAPAIEQDVSTAIYS